MRLALISTAPALTTLTLAALAALSLAACRDTHVSRGLPVLAKAPDGVLISGAGGLPDLERGNQERLAGRLEEAERDLLPLAQRGYADAQMYLAAVYGQREGNDSQDEAIKWYRTVLPQRPDAAIPLARLLMHQGDRESVAAANNLLLQAKEGVDEGSLNAAMLDLYSLFPTLDEKKRARAIAQTAAASTEVGVRASAINWYRASISDAGNARRLVELCRKNRELIPACYVDLATYYRYKGNAESLAKTVDEAMQSLQRPMSYANFDDFYYDPVALPPIASRLATVLIDQPLTDDLNEINEDLSLAKEAEANAAAEAGEESLDDVPATGALPQVADAGDAPDAASARAVTPASNAAHPELADKLLRWMLKQAGAMAVEAAGVAVAFPYLLPDVNLESVLKAGVTAGIPRASLYLGQLYYFNQRVPREAALGEASLMRGLQFRETDAPSHYRLGRLYQMGYLGRPDSQKAMDNFLYAARRRVTAADTHLARLFYDSPGTRINRVNSYVFARLSEDGGVPVVVRSLRGGTLSTFRLLDRLRAELTPEELKKAESLYQQEREVHVVMRPFVSPAIWVKDAG